MRTPNLCFELKYKKSQSFLSENFQFLEVKFSKYLNRHVFVMTVLHCIWASAKHVLRLPAHLRILIRVFAGTQWVAKDPKCSQADNED